jgi:RNA polymerase sigma-70 factor, ECF subfamily
MLQIGKIDATYGGSPASRSRPLGAPIFNQKATRYYCGVRVRPLLRLRRVYLIGTDALGDEIPIDDLITHSRHDAGQLGRLLEFYRPYLLIVATGEIGRRLAVRCDAEDIVQLTMLKAHQGFSGFTGQNEPQFSDWITTILRNSVIEMRRKHGAGKRDLDQEVQWQNDGTATRPPFDPAGSDTSISKRMIKRENAVRLAHRLQLLPQSQQEALRLKFFEGMSVAEIAQQMGGTNTAVAGLLKRGLAGLRQNMSSSSWR